MALELKLKQVVEDKAGLYTVYAQVVDSETGKVVGKKCVQGKTKAEIKDALRPSWQKIKDDYEKQQLIKGIAEQALNELGAEL